MYERISGWIGEKVSNMSDKELSELYEEIYRSRENKAIQPRGTKLKELNKKYADALSFSGITMTLADTITYEMARRYANEQEHHGEYVVIKIIDEDIQETIRIPGGLADAVKEANRQLIDFMEENGLYTDGLPLDGRYLEGDLEPDYEMSLVTDEDLHGYCYEDEDIHVYVVKVN